MNKNVVYILTVLEAIEKIHVYVKDFTDANSLYSANNQLEFNASLALLMAIAEESKKVDEELKELQPEINWKSVYGFRNELAHNYRGIDKQIVWNIIKTKLKPLQQACISILKNVNPDKNKLKDYLNSDFYKHLKYLSDCL